MGVFSTTYKTYLQIFIFENISKSLINLIHLDKYLWDVRVKGDDENEKVGEDD